MMATETNALYNTIRDRASELLGKAAERLSPGEEHSYDGDIGSLSGDELYELQNKRLQYTVEYAWENSDFYRELMEEEGLTPADFETVEDLEKLPVVTGEDIRQNQPPETRSHRFAHGEAQTRRMFKTSGSTGLPKTIYKSYDEADAVQENDRRGLEYFGVEAGDTVVSYLPFVGLNMSSFEMEGGLEKLGAETVPVSNTPYPTEIEAGILKESAADVVIGLPSHLDAKASAFEEEGYEPTEFGIDKLLVGGEPLSKSRKEEIEQKYDAELRNIFASTETGAFAFECGEEDNKFHMLDDRVYADVVRESEEDEEVFEDGEGHLVVTNLLHPGEESSMPLLNYDLGDIAEKEEETDCECGLSTGMSIQNPRRGKWSFNIGGINLSTVFFEESIYNHPDLEDAVTDYQIKVGYDDEAGKKILDVVIETEEFAGEVAEDIKYAETSNPENKAEEFGRYLLDENSHLRDTLDTVNAGTLNIRMKDEIETGKGKPTRLVRDHD